MSDIIKRLNDIWSDDDHARGCQGREYTCTCGYDERSFKTAEEAAAEILSLRQSLSEARAEARREAEEYLWELEVDDGSIVLRSGETSITIMAETATIYNILSGTPARKIALDDDFAAAIRSLGDKP